MPDCKIKLRFTSIQKQFYSSIYTELPCKNLKKYILVSLPRQGMHFLMTNNVCGCNADSVLGLKVSKSFTRSCKDLITAAVYEVPTHQRNCCRNTEKILSCRASFHSFCPFQLAASHAKQQVIDLAKG